MFLKVNELNTVINLKNITNIKIDKINNRIIFNFNYSKNLTCINKNTLKPYTKIISDYCYYDFKSEKDMTDFKQTLMQNSYIKDNFIDLEEFSQSSNIVNRNHIASIKYEHESRVILAFDNSVSFQDVKNNVRTTSDFIYIDFDDKDQCSNFIENLESRLF